MSEKKRNRLIAALGILFLAAGAGLENNILLAAGALMVCIIPISWVDNQDSSMMDRG